MCENGERYVVCMTQGVEILFARALFYRDVPDEFLKVARIAFPWNSTEDTPKLTGIPPHVLLMAEIEDLKNKFQGLQATIKHDMTDASHY